ncbi:MAG: alkyl sulfatase dimerization domain-containing protein [Candidatus Latescibacteria bacterium]|jgi:alkyl sulfatase BDS1-like metallo-beta-lactamase superfamily hydrolase|nr:alkyl sulfatase dimerization domain-containing protein [Candidatus Latescibacterota bacterium]
MPELKAIQLLGNQPPPEFLNPVPDIYTAKMKISGCGWVKTDDGVVLIDTLVSEAAARITYKRIHETAGKIKYIIYTHGHRDHVNGAPVFMADEPEEIIANHYLPARLDKYKMLAQHRNRVSGQQFNLPERTITPEEAEKTPFVYPTKTFQGEYTFTLGEKTFECHTARGETDDLCWVWIPELKAAFIGDLIIRSFPNIGNPWKPTRFTLDWAKALEEVRAKEPEHIFFSGAGFHMQGSEAIETLEVNIEAIRNLHDQVIDCINRNVHITEMIHEIKLPDHLANHPQLRFGYSRPEFFVYNTYRWYHGYFDGNPANLIPRPVSEVNTALLDLIGDAGRIVNKAREYMQNDQAQLGLQVLDVLIQGDPEHIEARKLRIEMLEKIGAEDYCVMSRNAWVYFIEKDREFLKSKDV